MEEKNKVGKKRECLVCGKDLTGYHPRQRYCWNTTCQKQKYRNNSTRYYWRKKSEKTENNINIHA